MSILTDLWKIRELALHHKRQASYYKEQVVPPFTVEAVGVYHYTDLAQIISPLPGTQTFDLWDSWWSVPDWEDSVKVIEWDLVDQIGWKDQVRDCDKFAFYFRSMMSMKFMSNHVAVVRDNISHHAYNLIWVPRYEVPFLFEPQNDRYWWATDPDPSPGMHDFSTAKILT